jgi:hypothetical protein
MAYQRPPDDNPPQELPGRWDNEPAAAPKKGYSLQRSLSGDESQYQSDLQKILEREEKQLSLNKMEGDLLGLEDGREGFSIGTGWDGAPTLMGGFGYRGALWSLAGALLLIALALLVRGCYGTEADLAVQNPPAAGTQSSPSPGN